MLKKLKKMETAKILQRFRSCTPLGRRSFSTKDEQIPVEEEPHRSMKAVLFFAR